ncbi:MAG TPA: hypothetical protein VFN37_02790 [Candidatus Baltobacteraceae bacterium]|nr:hypothetical protein [Candidatus Baltobacteraceae bacterium]
MTYLLRAPGQNSGPGTFAVSSSGAGVCHFGMYDVYTNRSSAIAPLTVPVQVMGALQLNGGSGWSSNVALAFTTPTAGAQAVSAGKTYDAEQLAPSFPGSPCAGLATATTTGYSTQSTPSSNYTSASFDVAPAGAAGGGTCTLQVSDQYNEPSTTVSVSVASGLFVGDASLNPVGSVTLVANGSGGWVPQSLYLWKKFLASSFSGTVNYGSCAGYAYVGPSAPSIGTSGVNGSSQDLPFTIYGQKTTLAVTAAGNCSMSFSDNVSDAPVPLEIVVDPQPTPTPAPNVYDLKEVWVNNSTGTPTTYAYSDTVKPCGNDPSQTTECGTITNLEPPGYQGPPSTAPGSARKSV